MKGMKLPATFSRFSPVEIGLLIAFIGYIVFPISTPSAMKPLVDSPLGFVAVFIITIALFVYTNPILGIVYIFVAYELFRRSTKSKPLARREEEPRMTQQMPQREPQPSQSQSTKDAQLRQMNPTVPKTLEEEMVAERAPIGHGSPVSYTESSFLTVANKVVGASLWA